MKKKFFYTLFVMQFLVNSLILGQNVSPVKDLESKYSFSFANIYFEVDAAIGGRVSSFKLDSTEILNFDATNIPHSGSTFWPSPQWKWKWPPIAVLDHKPYKAVVLNNKLLLSSEVSSGNLRVVKIFSSNLQDSSISIKYVMKNEGKTDITWAPWEITRVKASGITFFGKGDGTVTGNMESRTSETCGIVWYNQNIIIPSNSKNKFFCDGKGWLAHVTLDSILFIKKFTDVSLATVAPSENEIEVYTNSNKLYSELENQGAYVTISPKDSVVWEVKWLARKLPKNIPITVGSSKLVAFTNKLIDSNSITSGASLKKDK